LAFFNRGSKLSSWFITVTVRECWKLRQKSGRTVPIEDSAWSAIAESADPAAATSEDQMLLLERQHFVRTAVQKLGEQCRSLLLKLFYSDEKSYSELSAELGMPVPSIGPKRGRCLTRLKQELEKMGYR
jgi:RNA polymerase sigma factor (sigma-70 family)